MNAEQGHRPLLMIRNLYKKYGTISAVENMCFDVYSGETLVLMGPSGCGKSTTIRCINRLTEPDSGSIVFDGTEVTTLDENSLGELRKRIGFVFQGFNLIHRLSCLDNVSLGLVVHGMGKDEARKKAFTALEKVGLHGQADKRPGELSGGQQQRVGIARAMASDPEMMLWDEPTASLDPILVREVLDVMEDLASGKKTTMIVVTHELAFAKKAATRIALMDAGRIVEEGSPHLIFDAPSSRVGKLYKSIMDRW